MMVLHARGLAFGALVSTTMAIAISSVSAQTMITNVRVFDGTGVREDGDVYLLDGRIGAIGRNLTVPEGVEVVDAAGHTLLPGLIDSHTHVIAPAMLKQALQFGVTTELDMFMDCKQAERIRAGQALGEYQDHADLRSAGTLVTAPGGHGTEYGVPIPTITRPEDAQAFVDARIEEKSDYIKLVYDTGVAYGITYNSIDKPTMTAVIEAAHRRGKLAVVHISNLQAARDAIEAQADGLVHLFFEPATDPDIGDLLARSFAFVIPTLTVLESATGVASGPKLAEFEAFLPFLSTSARRNIRLGFPVREGVAERFAGSMKALLQLRDAGVPILAGSDAPNPGTAHGASLHRELELFVEAGLTPLEALRSATSVPASWFGLTDRGRIRTGLRADLLLVKGDPTRSISATQEIVAVWKAGQRVERVPTPKAGEGAPLAVLARTLISDFETGEIESRFGAGWTTSTDQLVGGMSTAEMNVAAGGAGGSEGCLSVTGVVSGADSVRRWAGVMFTPGDAPMSPVNLSNRQGISFWAKGDGNLFNIMLFLQSQGFTPVVQAFQPGSEWTRHEFAFSDFSGSDGSDVMGVFFGSSQQAGEFSLHLDNLKLEEPR